MADYVAYFNGDFIPFSQVKIDPMDRGFLVGDCVFDVARTFNGKSFRMREHVDRLYRSLKYVRIDPGLTPEELERISEEVISRNEHLRADVGDYQLWQFVTRGRGRWAHKAGPPAVGICTRQMGFVRYAHLYDSGAHGVVVRTRSFNPDALDPKVKNVPADVARAKAIVLKQSDLGAAWTSRTSKQAASLKAPVCPSLRPDYSKMVLTGHAESVFDNGNGAVSIVSDVEIWQTEKQARQHMDALMKPALPTCIRYALLKSVELVG